MEVVEGFADHQPQRPFSSLRRSLLMVLHSSPVLLFFFLIIKQKDGVVASMQPWLHLRSTSQTSQDNRDSFNKGSGTPNAL